MAPAVTLCNDRLSLMLCYGEIKTALLDLTKECHALWEENKDMQARFVNDLTELHRMQLALSQLERDNRFSWLSIVDVRDSTSLEQKIVERAVGIERDDRLSQARTSMSVMQKRASQLYNALMEKRSNLTQKLSDGVHNVALLQNQLIKDYLYDWKNRQKLQQVGMPFEERDHMIDKIQTEFEMLAEQNWQLRAYACWQMDLLRRGPQMNGHIAQTHIANLNSVLDNLTKLLCMLVSQSFVVAIQPEPVLKTQHKFLAEVRLLIGDKLGIKQHLVNTNVTVRIIAEEEARLLSTAQLSEKDVKVIGSISNDFEKITTDDKGHMSAKFSNSKLTRIAHRKPPPKGGQGDCKVQVNSQTAIDQKYALLFHITPFQLGNLGKFDVWTLSLPIMVTVHGSQDCDAQGAILWQRAFSDVNRTTLSPEIGSVSWKELAQVLRHKFAISTGAERTISDSDLSYMAEKLKVPVNEERKLITLHRFAKFWDEGWLIGFISKQDASSQMVGAPHPTFLLRFSDTQTGAVSIGFVCDDEGVPFHLSPFSIKDLDQFSLAQRIASCPQLKDIKYLYPDIDKEDMLRYFETEERQNPCLQQATFSLKSRSGCQTGGDSPLLSFSAQTKLDWSPGEIIARTQSAEMNENYNNEEIVTVLSSSLENDIEALLGPGFHTQLSNQSLQFIDISFISGCNNSQNKCGDIGLTKARATVNEDDVQRLQLISIFSLFIAIFSWFSSPSASISSNPVSDHQYSLAVFFVGVTSVSVFLLSVLGIVSLVLHSSFCMFLYIIILLIQISVQFILSAFALANQHKIHATITSQWRALSEESLSDSDVACNNHLQLLNHVLPYISDVKRRYLRKMATGKCIEKRRISLLFISCCYCNYLSEREQYETAEKDDADGNEP
ncbi:Signal transducer and activator of transcription 1 [Dirofilaria immitis]|nr:Signal transducer and activator of transcription 1 [Dirofilaria immitis]